MNEERIQVWCTLREDERVKGAPTEYETRSYIPHSSIEAVVREVYRRERQREWEEFKAGCDDPANRTRDIPDDGPDPETVREYVQAAAETVPAESVRELVTEMKDMLEELLESLPPRKSCPSGDAFCGPGAFEPAAPYGTVDAHLAEQMKDPEFRAEYLDAGLDGVRAALAADADLGPGLHGWCRHVPVDAGESELRRLAGRVVQAQRDMFRAGSMPGDHHRMHENRLQSLIGELGRVLEPKD